MQAAQPAAAPPSMPIEWLVGPADASLKHAALSLLPELVGAELLPSRLWIASARGRPAEVFGAAAFVPVLRDQQHPGFRCFVRVLPRYRRRGIGRSLLLQMLDEARRWDVPRLNAWWPVDENGPEAQVLRAMGFTRSSTMHYFTGEVAKALPASARFVAALRARGRVPAGVATVPLHEVPRHQVVALYQRLLGGSWASTEARITRVLEDSQARALSVAAWDSRRLFGFMLMTLRDACPEADFWVSDPDQRNGWVAALTLQGALEQLAALGYGGYRFHCNEHVHATMNFARRSGAQCIAQTHCLAIGVEEVTNA